MTDTDNDVVVGELVEDVPGGLDLGPLGPLMRSLGIDPDALLGQFMPGADDVTIADIAVALVELDQKLDRLLAVLEPVAQALAANAGKLRRYGINIG